MKRIMSALGLMIIFGFVFSMGIVTASEKPKQYIGLHDHVLKFGQDDIKTVEDKLFVPLDTLIHSLNATIIYADKMYVGKNKHVLIYDYVTGKTIVDDVVSIGKPIRDINGELFADVSYIAASFGFHFEYFSDLNVSRIYSDTYKSLRGSEYVKHMNVLLGNVVPPTKPVPVPKPEKPSPSKGKANVYLTFDDGPNLFTTKNLATLKKYDVESTFFFLGNQMNYYPKIVKNVASEGHYIGSHSITHDQKKVYASSKSFMSEMSSGALMIKKLSSSKDVPKLMRVPYGSKPHLTPAMKGELKKEGYKIWDWDVDSNDWKYSDKQYSEIVKNVQDGVNRAYKAGDRDIVVLLHDRSQTAIALPQIIEWLKKEGYTMKKYNPASHVVQNFHRDVDL
ncbi:polysaccharide deacetylase family protein [Sporosarcina siberiensis]|uniref:Polysaccharide deacetylase family protein n=1 Tax=Sporosarcina siberiensis TaxID=1365606 RepID=A0ABW4SIG6_9BACL